MFLIGPGPLLEPLMREAAKHWGIPTYLMRPVDDSLGNCWRQMNAERMHRAVSCLLDYEKPTRLLAFEPVIHPATANVIARARAKGIEVIRSEEETPVAAPPVREAVRQPALFF